MTGPTGAVSTISASRWHSTPNAVVDANGNKTWLTYDAFGRITQVDKTAANTAAASKADLTLAQTVATYAYPGNFAYSATPGSALKVTSTSLVKGTWAATATTAPAGAQKTYTFVNGFGRVRQVQAKSPQDDGSSVVSISRYDSRGLQVGQSAPTWFSSAPGTFIAADDPSLLKSYTHTDFDALERPYQAITSSLGTNQFTTATNYNGDKTIVTPPTGGSTTTFIDARGRTTSTVQDIGSTTATTTYTYTFQDGAGSTVKVTAPPTTTGGAALSDRLL